jgi:hypothetical protein
VQQPLKLQSLMWRSLVLQLLVLPSLVLPSLVLRWLVRLRPVREPPGRELPMRQAPVRASVVLEAPYHPMTAQSPVPQRLAVRSLVRAVARTRMPAVALQLISMPVLATMPVAPMSTPVLLVARTGQAVQVPRRLALRMEPAVVARARASNRSGGTLPRLPESPAHTAHTSSCASQTGKPRTMADAPQNQGLQGRKWLQATELASN